MSNRSHAARVALAGLLLGAGLLAGGTARAQFTVNATQVGGDVVFTGSGALNISGLAYEGTSYANSGVASSAPTLSIGPGKSTPDDVYALPDWAGPGAFGTNSGLDFTTIGTGGQVVAAFSAQLLGVPYGYVSGAAIEDSMTFTDASFESLYLTPGIYTWSWGSGATAGAITLDIGQTSIAEPASLPALAIGVACLVAAVRRRNAGKLA